ncbi:MAG: cell wall-binding repeat-containing protein, partial [Bradymonadaceae bacterium]
LPTPDTEEYHRYVGAFEGAGYCERGRYRPSHTCLMRSRQEVMCAVCRHERDQYVIGLEQVRDAEEEHWRRREEQIGRQAAREERERRLEEYTLSEQERIDRCHHVQRIDGANMYATAANISQALFPNGASTVILATDQEFSTDAMAAGPLAASLGAPFMPVGRNSLSPYTKAEIERLGARKVIIVGGRISVTPLVTRELKKMGLEVERISGMTRFKTAREIAMELHKIQGSTSKSAFIVAADNISIRASITAGSLAAALNAPVLFVKHDSIPRSTARTLRELGIEHTYVVGGLGRINEAVFADLPGAERVNADTIYSLATTLATQAMDDELTDRSRFFIAHGDRPSDSVAASTGGHIILLTETERLNIFTRGFFEKHSRDTVILGDESVISENVRDELCEFLPPI